MTATPRFARRFLFLRLLVGSLVLGAFYDLAYAVVMVAAPQVPARAFNLPLPPPEGTFYLWILAVVLAMLAALYLLAARDPRRYSGIIAVAMGGRILGGLVLLAAALRGLPGLYPMAVADLVFGLAHAAFWLPIRS
ncbi:MAG TPA: hypothetical protein VEL74_01710 [Thermoanaerobaculia bacterium]|nr:hypothetical protein [Thermoanaerobaculia bacterium]